MSQESRIVPLFKCRTHGSVILEDGTLVAFANKQFYTQDARLIERLKVAASRGEFGIYIDPKDPTIDLDAATPMERLRKQIREELLAEQNANKVAAAASTTSSKVAAATSVASTVSTAPVQQNQAMNALQKLKATAAGNANNSEGNQES